MFASFWGGGFECASHRRLDRRRLDLADATGHLRHAAQDYRALARAGLRWARDGLRWHAIEAATGARDWDDWRRQLAAAEAAGVRVGWDLIHFGFPDHVDLLAPDFPARAAAFAGEAARVHRAETGRPFLACMVNEISFLAFAAGDRGWFQPWRTGEGDTVKEALVRAAIAMTSAVRGETEATLFTAEPLIAVISFKAEEAEGAAAVHASQFAATDWLTGRARPELGGAPGLVDLFGWNHYPHNQWIHLDRPLLFGAPDYVPLSRLLRDAAGRYPGKPLFLAETGAEGAARGPWVHYVGQEARHALAMGVDLAGACLYPITDYPGWDNDRHCPTGLFGYADADGARPVDPDMLAALEIEAARFSDRRQTAGRAAA